MFPEFFFGFFFSVVPLLWTIHLLVRACACLRLYIESQLSRGSSADSLEDAHAFAKPPERSIGEAMWAWLVSVWRELSVYGVHFLCMADECPDDVCLMLGELCLCLPGVFLCLALYPMCVCVLRVCGRVLVFACLA